MFADIDWAESGVLFAYLFGSPNLQEEAVLKGGQDYHYSQRFFTEARRRRLGLT